MQKKLRIIRICVGAGIAALLVAIAIPNLRPARVVVSRSSCVDSLQRITDAKARWAAEHGKGRGDAPTDEELFGEGRYIPNKPECPARGVYSLGRVSETARCSVREHNEQFGQHGR